jgi:hypothetical protein
VRVEEGGMSVPRPREWDACFPAAVLLVDSPRIVDAIVATGVLVQARIAVVAVDGSPAHVVSWLRRGFRLGHRAPVGYLHDASTVLYPFLIEPLATLVAAQKSGPIAYRDLGIGPGRRLRDPLRVASARAGRARRLADVPAASLAAFAAQELLRMVPPDPLLLPIQAEMEKSS